MKNKTKNKIN